MLLVAGTLEMGRGYSAAIAASDAARDGARFLAGKSVTANGPGNAAVCKVVTADLVSLTTNVSCSLFVTTWPPTASSYAPTAGQAIVVLFCGSPTDCAGTSLYAHKLVGVAVYYGFGDLNLLGGGITISGTSLARTSW
ncbi:MAG: hypothetical protein ACREOM_04575 [Candidatus Dormibacteraceae bacterium]